jgi:O-antigen ligase
MRWISIMSKENVTNDNPSFNLNNVIILILTFLVPLIVLPQWLDNAFHSPKSFLMLTGVILMIGTESLKFLRGKSIALSKASTPFWMLLIILLNVISFFYTKNYYHTRVAVVMNLSCLFFLYFVSLNTDGKKASFLMGVVALSGVLVSLLTYLQFTGHFILFKWAEPGTMAMGTIGNSNYLGAYLLFPLFALSGMIFMTQGRWRIVLAILWLFVFGALLFSRARASWLGLGISFPVFLVLMWRIRHFSVRDYIRSNPKRIMLYGLSILVLFTLLWAVAPQRFHEMMAFKKWTETKTLKLRMKYFRASLWLFKESPLFGTGPWSYRNMVYEAQAEINKKDPEYFKRYVEPKPRRVHNEYLEILNDGGLVGAGILSLFLILVMGHGWRVMVNPEIPIQERVVTATAFSSMTGMMVAALFFFPFRVNSTLFLTALMMGIMEGIYLRRHGLLDRKEPKRVSFSLPAITLTILILAGVLWFCGWKPFYGELEHFRYKKVLALGKPKVAEKYLLHAISLDPHNTLYCLYAGQLYMNAIRDNIKAVEFVERAINNFNGDVTRWSPFYMKGILKHSLGSLYEARRAFKEAITYNPNFTQAHQKLEEVEKILKDHDKVLIKLR